MLTRDGQIGRSLQKADSRDRALLELSLRRRVKDDVVAAVLRMPREDVSSRREAALARLADDMGIEDEKERSELGDAVAALPAEQWPPAGAPERVEGELPPRDAVVLAGGPPPRRRRVWPAVLIILGGALLGALLGLLIFGGDDEESGGGGPPERPAPAARRVPLEPVVPGFPGRGTASITGSGEGSRLVLTLRDLPPREEAYGVWLYDSVTDAVAIDSVVGTRLHLDRRLPVDPARYRYLDVSREPIDDNPNHSGASVMRVPVESLLAGR
jgi:hypothetical protein